MKQAKLLAGAILGSVFIYASLSKIASPFRFATVVQSYQLIPERLVSLMAIAIPWLELLCGVAVLVAVLQRASAWILCGLSLVFALAISQALFRGLDLDCGCFAGPSKIGWGHVVIDLILAVVAAWLATRANQSPVANANVEKNSTIYRVLVAAQLVAFALLFNASSVAQFLGTSATKIQLPLLALQAACVIAAVAILVFQRSVSTTLRTAFFVLLIPLTLGFAAKFSNPLPQNRTTSAIEALGTLQKRGIEKRIEAALMDLDFRHHPHLFADKFDIAPVASALKKNWSSADYFDSVDCRTFGVEQIEPGSKILQTKCMVEGHTIEKDETLGHLRLQMEMGFDIDKHKIVALKPLASSETIQEGSSLPGWSSGWETDDNVNPTVESIQLPPHQDRLVVFFLPRMGEFPDPPFELPDGVRVYSTHPTKIANPIPKDISQAELESVFHGSDVYRTTGGAFVSDANGRVLWVGPMPPTLSRLRQLLKQTNAE